jgi:hypothetical protein
MTNSVHFVEWLLQISIVPLLFIENESVEIRIPHPNNTQYNFYALRWKLIITPWSSFLRIFLLIWYFSVVVKFFSQAVLYFTHDSVLLLYTFTVIPFRQKYRVLRKLNKEILSLSCPLYVLWSPLFVCLCSCYVCPTVMFVTRMNYACSLNYMLNRYSAFCVSQLPWLNVKGLVKIILSF